MKPPQASFPDLARQYRTALLDDVLPFWIRHSPDREYGGYFSCLDRDGSVYDTDKFVWLQARQVWTFSMLCNRIERRKDWLALARQGAAFLQQHGRAADGSWYFSLTREGRPLIEPYNVFSDCFAAMAFGQFAQAAGSDEARQIAERTYRNILARQPNPKGRFSKAVPGTRDMASLSLPMILLNLTLELEGVLDPELAEQTLSRSLSEIFGRFLDESRMLFRENVAPDGRPLDCFEGRVVNPGHGIEAMWFVLDIAERRNDAVLAERATQVALRTLEFGWDGQYGGIFHFLDAHGHPPQQLEWDQKLWWVHLEALIAMLKGYRLTRNPECLSWFQRIHDYSWSRFPDPKFGEWFGYLNRQGEVLLPLKGGKWKGCFHLPRCLYLCARECEALGRG